MRMPIFARDLFRWNAYSYIGVCCLLATLCFAAVCASGYIEARRDAERRAEAAASDAASIAAHDIAETIERFDSAIQATGTRVQTPAIMALDETLRNLVLFAPVADIKPLGFLDVLDENGQVIASSRTFQRGSSWSYRDYFVAQRVNPAVGLYISRPFGQDDYASVALSRRLSNGDGKFAGVVVAGLRLDYLHDLFVRLAIGTHGSIALLRNDGTLLMELPVDRNDIGRVVDMSAMPNGDSQRLLQRPVGDLPLLLRIRVASGGTTSGMQAWIMAMIAGVLLGSVSLVVVTVLQRETSRREAAERNNRHVIDYLAMTSDDLRTPLRVIIANADSLHADTTLDPVNARRVMAIASAGKHLRGVIDRALNWLRVEARLPTPRMSYIDLGELLEQCCIIIETDAVAKSLGLRYGFKAGAPERFVTDVDLLRQVLVNLLINAVKFTERGEVTMEVGGSQARVTKSGYRPVSRSGQLQRSAGSRSFGLRYCTGWDSYPENAAAGRIFPKSDIATQRSY